MKQYERLKKLTGFNDEECEVLLSSCSRSVAIAVKFIERIEFNKNGKEEAIRRLKLCNLYDKYLRHKVYGDSDNRIVAGLYNDKCAKDRFKEYNGFSKNNTANGNFNAKVRDNKGHS